MGAPITAIALDLDKRSSPHSEGADPDGGQICRCYDCSMPPLLKALLLSRHRRRKNYATTTPDDLSVPGLSVAVLAHNEADVLRGCLESVTALASEILVADAESQDHTAAVAAEYGATVIPVENRLEVDGTKNVAIGAARHDWVLILDPDERVSAQLRQEIAATIEREPTHDGYLIPRRNYELGRWIRTMGHYPGPQLRLVRRGRGSYATDQLHAHLRVDGSVGVLTHDLIHVPQSTIWTYAHKRNFYTEQAARRHFSEGVRFSSARLVFSPLWEFVRQYILFGGWLEGVPGFIIAAHGGWAKFLTEAKLWQKWDQLDTARDESDPNRRPATFQRR